MLEGVVRSRESAGGLRCCNTAESLEARLVVLMLGMTI